MTRRHSKGIQDALPNTNTEFFSLLDPSTLADDPALLKQLLATLLQMLAKETRRREEVERHIDALLKRMTRSKSLVFSDGQQLLFDLDVELNETPPEPAVESKDDEPNKSKHKCGPHGRRKPPGDLEIEEIIHDLPDNIKQQFPEGTLVALPDVVTFQYDYRPGRIIQLRHVQKKYVTIKHDSGPSVSEILEPIPAGALTPEATEMPPVGPTATSATQETATVPTPNAEVTSLATHEDLVGGTDVAENTTPAEEQPAISGDSSGTPRSAKRRILLAPKQCVMSSCLAAPGLLAMIWLNKFGDHLPLYRQEEITRRYGIHFARSTLCDWMLQLAAELTPLYQLMVAEVLKSRVIHTDDTTVQRQDPVTKKRSTARFWNYVGDEEHLLTVFEFTLTHERTWPAQFLRDFRGYLQADAYSGCDGLYLDSNGRIVEVGCWFHARKRFKAAVPQDVRATVGLAYIKQIYAIERKLRDCKRGEWAELSVDDRAARVAEVRTELTVPILQQFEHWLRATEKAVLPKDALSDAIRYTLNQ
ncbi:MAG: IS66 family transposase [Planctomycetales bacterium]|nr:IS66 family transposase [Planctomycetales bacterium]MCA9265427.1 IS66 family transposase [Planctomycetales bacterium]